MILLLLQKVIHLSQNYPKMEVIGSKRKLMLTLRIFRFLLLPLDLLILAFAVTSLLNVYVYQFQISGFFKQVSGLWSLLCSFYIFLKQDPKILFGLVCYSLISLVLGALVQYGLHSRRKWLLLPHMIFMGLLILLVLVLSLSYGHASFLYLLLLPLIGILLLVR